MKHLIKSDGFIRAWCKRPGCVASLEGGIVQDMNQKSLNEFFEENCPYVYIKDKKETTQKERIDYLLKYAKKEIKDWEKLISYWRKYEKTNNATHEVVQKM